MPFRPEAFHEVAKKLAQNDKPSGEGKHRTVVGRAYYAAYHATAQAIYLTHKVGPEYELPAHETLSRTLAESLDPEIRHLGQLLHGLRLSRVHADYHLVRAILELNADDSVQDSAQILELLGTDLTSRLPKIVGTFRTARR